ncbi:MAG: DNA replication and repair protein RecF [Alphaproteobacteria bacterium]|nr:MAG: DNA replication and repair protein RecF [Alphaproteobacteria bacterium]
MDNGSRVHLSRLKLQDFRNYEQLTLACDARHVVLTGDNGAGKTNLLEAVSFLSPGRGLRRAPYESVARAGSAGGWSVFAELAGVAGPVSIGTGIPLTPSGPESQRRVRINGAPARGADELLDHARIVWLTPAMDGLFTGPAGDRRKFLDRLVLAVNPAHGRHVADFDKAMRARNRLLADATPDPRWLEAIEAQMAETGVAIVLARLELAGLLSRLIVREAEPASPFPDALIGIDGTLDLMAADLAASDLETAYADRLRAGRRLDAAAGRTLEGPHRSDLKVGHRPKAMAAELCSTGEQKALLIGLVLAHARLVAELSGFAPILLLDEIAAHLDSGRRSALFDRIDALDCQAWLTGTERSLFAAMAERAQYFTVIAGTVTPGR